MKQIYRKYSLISFILLHLTYVATAQMTPQEAIVKMNRGMNVGNSMELANEGESGRYIQEHYFTDFKKAGFNCVRIPIRWDKHTGTTTPYTINATWLNRVEQVVNWSLKHGLITIINTHHDDWILNDVNYTTTDLARFKAIWTQVAERFKDKSDSLIFEIANEPNIAIEKTDLLNSSVIPIIRISNPTRIIIFGSSGTQLSTLKKAKVPNDKYLIASFHTYEPWDITFDGKGTWGTEAQIKVVKALMADAAAWSTTYKIPLFLGEFGSTGRCDINSRMKWLYTHVEEAHRKNIATCLWSDFGDFSIYSHTTSATGTWNTVLKDILVYTHPLSAESVVITVVNGSNAQLNWNNRAADYKGIRIERKEGSGAYKSLATIDGTATTYVDATAIVGKTYTYRAVCELITGEVTASFPVEKKIAAIPTGTKINTIDEQPEWSAYFTNDILVVKTNSSNRELFYRLISLSGNVIKSGSFQTNESTINTSFLSKGIYLVTIFNTGGETKTKKVVKY